MVKKQEESYIQWGLLKGTAYKRSFVRAVVTGAGIFYLAILPYAFDSLNESGRKQMSYEEAWKSFYQEYVKPTLEDCFTWEGLEKQNLQLLGNLR